MKIICSVKAIIKSLTNKIRRGHYEMIVKCNNMYIYTHIEAYYVYSYMCV